MKLRFDIHRTSAEKVLSNVTDTGSVADITISDPPLEEVIAKIYQIQDTIASAGWVDPSALRGHIETTLFKFTSYRWFRYVPHPVWNYSTNRFAYKEFPCQTTV
jgi:hypothetical protein